MLDTPHYSIEVKNLSCFRNDRLLFSEINFSVSSGEVLLVEGLNGSGKTTLLKMLCGLRSHDEGIIHFNRQTITKLGGDYTDKLSYLGHKNGNKADLTVRENLTFSSKLNDDSDFHEIIKRVGLVKESDRLSVQLSAGQNRRLAIARLLVSQHPLWILDEPFTALDSNGIAMMKELMGAHIQQGGLVILTSHHNFELEPFTVLRLQLSKQEFV
ncbi:MAG: cytochrome c biogenesis heme-transporting ATPase CcmA [Methylophaga sp.]|nr:cytochrome c biogenesis heme-transporting ATPase CcmA [Methylophaga sp.]